MMKLKNMGSFARYHYLLVFISLLYFAFPNPRLDFTNYNSHDSESYIALSKNLIEGRGYTRSLNDGEFIPHTLWPPGMAVILSPAVWASGETINFYYVKLTIILIAITGIWLTFIYISRLFSNKELAYWVAILLALNPYYWHFSRIAMTEIPVYVWIVLSLLLIHKYFKNLSSPLLFYCILGICIGLGMLLKGAVIGLILAPIPYLYRHGLFSYKSITKGGLYAICFCLPFVGWMISNQNIDRTHLGLDGVNQVQMITKKVIEDPQSEYKTPSEIVNTAKQNIAWHAIYHVPNQIIPSIHLFDLKNSSFGNYIALILCLALFIVLVKQAGTFSPLLLSVVPVIILATVMTIGGAERYWFTITSILLLPVFCYLLKSFQRTKGIIVVFFTIQLFSLIAFASNHESNPYTVIEDRDDLARLFIQAEKTCTNNQNTSIRNTWTKNEHAFQLVTGCKASMVNSAIGVDPTFTHAVLHLDKLQHSPSNIIKRANHYVWIELPEHMKKSEIIENYY